MISNANSIVDVLNSLESVIFLFIFACLIFYLTLKFVKWTKKWTEDLKEKLLKNLESKFDLIDKRYQILNNNFKRMDKDVKKIKENYHNLNGKMSLIENYIMKNEKGD